MNGLSFSLTEDHCNNKNTIASKEAELAQQIREISFEHLLLYRVAQSAGIGGLDPSIAKDLIDSEDPKHTLFCRDLLAF